MRPKRTDDKYWIGTRDFNHIQYESDLEDYIIDLENETQQLRIATIIKSLPDSYEIRMKARELDEKDFDQWWWETVYKGNVL